MTFRLISTQADSEFQMRSRGLVSLLEQDPAYAAWYMKCCEDAKSLSATVLRIQFKFEYDSWKNRKKWALDHGVVWHTAMSNFADFLTVVGPIPHQGWTLDRIEYSGAYVPENLRWASKQLQTRNRSNTRLIHIGRKLTPLVEVAKSLGQPYGTVRNAITRNPGYFDLKLFLIAQDQFLDWTEESAALKRVSKARYTWPFPEIDFSLYEKKYLSRCDISLRRAPFYLHHAYSDLDDLGAQKGLTDDEIERTRKEEVLAHNTRVVNWFVNQTDDDYMQQKNIDDTHARNEAEIIAQAERKLRKDTLEVEAWRREVMAEGRAISTANFPGWSFLK